MARQTNTRLREKVIYSVFVRNHTKEGTFQALEGDLERLAALGQRLVDVIRRSRGRDNKTLSRWAEQLRQLLDKWEE